MKKIEKKIEKDLGKYYIENPVIFEILDYVAKNAKNNGLSLSCILCVLDAMKSEKSLPLLLSPKTKEEVAKKNNDLLALYKKEVAKLKTDEGIVLMSAISITIDMFLGSHSEDKKIVEESVGLILAIVAEEKRK